MCRGLTYILFFSILFQYKQGFGQSGPAAKCSGNWDGCAEVNGKFLPFDWYKAAIHFNGVASIRNHRVVKELFQCIDTIYIDTPNNWRVLRRTKPRRNEKFKLYSSSISFMEKDDVRRSAYSHTIDRQFCAERSTPKNIKIEYLDFYYFFQDSILYPYFNHDEIEWLTLVATMGPMSLPGILSGHSKLKKLSIYGDFHDSIILSLNDNLSVFSNLESLYLNNVPLRLSDISNLKLLPSLKHLWIQDAGLTEFPVAITELKNLEVLVLNLECIDKLPDELKNLKKLKLLNLDATNVSPEEAHRIADQMPALRYLNHTRTPRLPCDGHDGRKKKN